MHQSKYAVCDKQWHANFQIFAFNPVFVNVKCTSNMAASYDNGVNNDTSPRVGFVCINFRILNTSCTVPNLYKVSLTSCGNFILILNESCLD